ncbi:MAG: endo-1,4-beta-xylanase [Bryobacterales bacterium]|nr:endo-1,4-beta-xylanase [Bryobacterales bacterium]MBV9401337.1 endo-1,4-beta-xylanase [Bryobacterales bacterium]
MPPLLLSAQSKNVACPLCLVFSVAAMLSAQSLRELGDARGVHVGSAVNPSHLAEPEYSATLAKEFSQIEPENAMKFGPIHPAPGNYNFGPADEVAQFARSHNQLLRGAVLVWHNQNPSWVTGGKHTPEQLSSILRDHIAAVVGHYAGQVYAWDVVNEAFTAGGKLRSTIWYDSPGIGLSGTGYVEQAFRWARSADPKALLFYNDYETETINSKSDAVYAMARDFKSRGVPIDGIGFQMHLTRETERVGRMEANIRRFTALGLQVQITELDVRLPLDSGNLASPRALARQAKIYRQIVELCLKFKQCTAVQTWGFTDKYSWIPRTYPGKGDALPFDSGYKPKPAYEGIVAAFKSRRPKQP